MNKSELQERRLSLLNEIAERADQISRIDNELKTDNKRHDSYE
jgi:hypothetical protein